MFRRKFLGVSISMMVPLAGCTGGFDNASGDLEIVSKRLSYDDDGAGKMYIEVKNNGERTNAAATVDLTWTSGEDEGDVFETATERAHLEKDAKKSIEVPTTYYRFDQNQYDYDISVSETGHPVAAFEVRPEEPVDGYWSPSVGEVVELDASTAISVDNSVRDFHWSLHDYGHRVRQDGKELAGLAPGTELDVSIPNGELVTFEIPDDELIKSMQDNIAAMVQLTVTDQNGNTDTEWEFL